MIPRLFRPLLAWEKRGRFSASLLLADAALAAWLFFAQRAFLGQPLPTSHTLAKFAAVTAVLGFVLRLHDFSGGKILPLLAKAVLLVPAVAIVAFKLHCAPPAALWLGLAVATLLTSLRVTFFAARARWPEQPLELFRWLFVLGAATVLGLPFYRAVSIGSGDAYWYSIMLADFTAQLRAGVFPVWVGQSEYAFNGAVSPLRLAPWFQHAGGLLDLLTAHALSPVALKNAVLAINTLAIAASAYGCLRVVLTRRPGLAAVLAALWVASPGVLTPVITSDLIMTYMAMPFLPLVLLGGWLVWTADDTRARVILAAGLAGAWLSHAPIALWATLFAVGLCTAKALVRREWLADTRRAALTSGVFVLLGTFPLLSVLAIDNQNAVSSNGATAAEEVARSFPANFLPIVIGNGANSLLTFQVGYTALGAFAVALLVLLFIRPRAALVFAVATLSVAVFVLPVPWINHAFWTHVPKTFVAINNVWPMQRLFGLWALMMLFTFAIVFADDRLARRTWLTTLALFALLGGGVWSWQEAAKLRANLDGTASTLTNTTNAFALRNLALTRYAYSSFSAPPAYFSHGYMDPYLENRLLDRTTFAELSANADHAAPAVRLPIAPGVVPRFVQAGVLTAVNINGDAFTLEPRLPLTPNVRHALRFEFFRPGRPGILQNIEHGQFREYLLPDAGGGATPPASTRAFGSLPTSGRVIPLQITGSKPADLGFFFIGSGSVDDKTPPSARFAFARYWLYTYAPSDLPIVVDSWIPYRAHTEAAQPAWLETPRMWITGYRATVNGLPAEVRRSPHDLVMVPLAAGPSTVTLEFSAPWWLRTSYWLALLGWLTLLTVCARRILATARSFASSPTTA